MKLPYILSQREIHEYVLASTLVFSFIFKVILVFFLLFYLCILPTCMSIHDVSAW